MAEKRTALPVLTVDTTGMALYDKGAEKAYWELFDRFAAEKRDVIPGRVGVLGVNPLDMSDLCAAEKIRAIVSGAVCYGMGSTLEDIKTASAAEKNIVCAPSGLAAARLLKKRFGTPYEVYDPLAETLLPECDYAGKHILVIDQQVRANSLRRALLDRGAASVVCAKWFMQVQELSEHGDIRLLEEYDLEELVRDGGYDLLIGDPTQWRIVEKVYNGKTADLPQFPVSGKLVEA